jgi:hypothetical protein
MGKCADDIVKQAESWLGYKESDGSHKKIIDVYNSHRPLAKGYKVKYTDSWCATFVSAVAIKCGATDIIPTECGCQRMIELCKQKGIWIENENRVPTKGELIFYDWQDNAKGDNQGWADHVGIVQKVFGNTIYVIEGNCSNSVKISLISVNDKYIRGYAKPNYDKVTTVNKKSIDELAKEVIRGKWGNGAVRRQKLEAAGYNYREVQNRVNEMLRK